MTINPISNVTVNPETLPNSVDVKSEESNGGLKNRISCSPIVKAFVAGLIAALVLGIFFGPFAALMGFCIGFASAYLGSLICTHQISETISHSRPSISINQEMHSIPIMTEEQIANDLEGFNRNLEERRIRSAALNLRAIESRKLLGRN